MAFAWQIKRIQLSRAADIRSCLSRRYCSWDEKKQMKMERKPMDGVNRWHSIRSSFSSVVWWRPHLIDRPRLVCLHFNWHRLKTTGSARNKIATSRIIEYRWPHVFGPFLWFLTGKKLFSRPARAGCPFFPATKQTDGQTRFPDRSPQCRPPPPLPSLPSIMYTGTDRKQWR